MSATATLSGVPAPDAAEGSQLASPAGSVAGTVLRAARISAYLTQAELGGAVGVDEASVAAWENGAEPLSAVPYPVFGRLEAALTVAGAEPGLVTDLTTATWCDLVLDAIAAGLDVDCLMADPTAAEEAFSELLTWSVGGRCPARYQPFADPGPVLPAAEANPIAGTVRKLVQAQRSFKRHAA